MQLLSSLVSTSQSAHAPSFPRRLCLVRHYLIPSLRRKADPLSCKGCRGAAVRVLCFHNLTNCFSRKPLLLITIRIAPGVGIPVVLYLATRHSPLPLYFHQLADSLTLFGLFFESSQFVFSNLRTLFAKTPGWGTAAPNLNCRTVSSQLSLLRAERPHRVNRRRAPCRHHASRDRYQQQQHCGGQ